MSTSESVITVDDLARELDVTRETIIVLVDQVADDADLWDAQGQRLTGAGAQMIREQIASPDPIVADELLEVESTRIALEQARSATDEAEQAYRAAIRSAVDKGHPRYRVAEHAGVTAVRIGQIHSGIR